ncbi:MAG: CapA family protein [Candidatus Dormibacteraeota bacterium]|nr:CapA family protein [Candidatus Dormibacteraeota bacterium]
MERRTLLCAVGDVLIDEDDPEHGFSRVAPLLNAADVVFGNCEGVYTDRQEQAPSAGIAVISPSHNIAGLGRAGFDVMSCANNHIVDGGHGALAETLRGLRNQGIEPVGAGRNIAEARRPARLARGGQRLAFLAYSSFFPAGYEARENVPGLAPVRFHNHYFLGEGEVQNSPAAIPEVLVVPDPSDRSALVDDIRRAASEADAVVVSFHWGEGLRPVVVFEYERETARLAIDAGACAVLCHHHHIVRGVDLYRGRPIFHGLGHFVFEIRHIERLLPESTMRAMAGSSHEYALGPREDYPLLPMHPETRMTMIATCEIVDGEVASAGVLPCYIEPDGMVTPLRPDTVRGAQVAEYLERIGVEAELGARLLRDDGFQLGGHPLLRVAAARSADLQPA